MIMQQSKIALGRLINQRFFIWTGGAIVPVYMLGVNPILGGVFVLPILGGGGQICPPYLTRYWKELET